MGLTIGLDAKPQSNPIPKAPQIVWKHEALYCRSCRITNTALSGLPASSSELLRFCLIALISEKQTESKDT